MIIGLTGKARSGKDTVARLLGEQVSVRTFAFATPIKSIIAESFGWGNRRLNGDLKEQVETVIRFDREASFKCINTWLEGVELDISTDDAITRLMRGLNSFQNISPRVAMQLLGTEIGREIDTDIWMKILKASLQFNHDLKQVSVVTDVRFDNEAKMINELGGFVVQIHRPNLPEVAAHSSEAGINERLVRDVIVNDGDLKKLKKTVEYYARRLAWDSFATPKSSFVES